MKPVTFLTGASSGFGAALAPRIAREGHSVALVARRTSEIEELAAKITSSGGTALPITCDVGDRNAVHQAVKECEQELGPVTRLIANAGLGELTPARNFDAGMVEQIMRVNYLGAVYCIEAVLPGMIERGKGEIVGVSSLAGYRGLVGMGGYCASKAALIALLESLRIELRGHNVSVTIICPGFVKTDMTARNKGSMPFLMELEDAAQIMHDAIRRKKTRSTFPWQLATMTRMARFLPDSIYDRASRIAEARE